MSKSQCRVNGLSSVRHTDQTRGIFNQLKITNDSDFLRKAIVHLAQKNGFDGKPDIRPYYIDVMKWIKIEQLYEKSFAQKNGEMVKSRGKRGVDYTYLYAFLYLRSTLEYRHPTSAELQRLAIIDYGTEMIEKIKGG